MHNDPVRNSLLVLHLLVKRLVEDNVAYVAGRVAAELDALRAARPDDEGLRKIRVREIALERWGEAEYPLAYSNNDGGYNCVCDFLPDVRHGARQDHVVSGGVPLEDIVRRLVDMTKPPTPAGRLQPVTAPAIPRASFIYCLRYAMPELHEQWDALRRSARALHYQRIASFDQFLLAGLRLVLDHLRVYFLPWNPEAGSTQRGRPALQTSHTSWKTISTSKDKEFTFRGYLERGHVLNLSTRAIQAQQGDPNGPWTFEMVTIQDLHMYLNKRLPPAEFARRPTNTGKRKTAADQPGAAEPVYDPTVTLTEENVADVTHLWSRRAGTWNLHHPIHQLFVIKAILFTKFSPRLFHNAMPGPPLSNAPRDITTFIRQHEWVARAGGKAGGGVTDTHTLCFMAATFMLALWDRESPLRVYHAQRKAEGKSGFGKLWAQKHRESCVCVRPLDASC